VIGADIDNAGEMFSLDSDKGGGKWVTEESCEQACESTDGRPPCPCGIMQPGKCRCIIGANEETMTSRRDSLSRGDRGGCCELMCIEELANGNPKFDEDGNEFENIDMHGMRINVLFVVVMSVVPIQIWFDFPLRSHG
jgi:hypothetical protein